MYFCRSAQIEGSLDGSKFDSKMPQCNRSRNGLENRNTLKIAQITFCLLTLTNVVSWLRGQPGRPSTYVHRSKPLLDSTRRT